MFCASESNERCAKHFTFDWAKESMAAYAKTGILSGRNGKTIMPKDEITQAEAAVKIQRLLQKLGLI
ncbi:MAG TPA: S-layer homology domain-containing protein [Clostridia bacterium]|nr:S-layer homology domain-containing protein [Clostridia bacterium]